MHRIIALIALFVATFIGCHAQTSVNVYVQDSVQCPSGFFSTHFAGVKINSSTGEAKVHFIGGDNADFSYVLSFETTDQSSPIWWETNQAVTFTSTGTYWIYLAVAYSTDNWDWIEVRVVSSSFSGTISALYGTAPYGWENGYPPSYAPMVTGTVPPPSQPAPVSISKILVPILVVVIVLAIMIPAGVYIYRRRKANKMAAHAHAQASIPETTGSHQVPIQMNSVVV